MKLYKSKTGDVHAFDPADATQVPYMAAAASPEFDLNGYLESLNPVTQVVIETDPETGEERSVERVTPGAVPMTFAQGEAALLLAGWEDVTGNWPPQPPGPTADQLKQAAVKAVQDALDAGAKDRGYDSILSLCTYATSSVPAFAAEGQAGVDWRDKCWSALYALIADIEAGKVSPAETIEDAKRQALGAIPVMHWPA